ncbi:MAG: M15 family metallopeptidase [Candidatus Spechtbacterales bacterium]
MQEPTQIGSHKISKEVVDSILSKLEREKEKQEDNAILLLSFEELFGMLSEEEHSFIDEILSLDPGSYGFRGPFLSRDPVSASLAVIKGQEYEWKGELKKIATQYLPEHVYDAFQKMNEEIEKDLGSRFLIRSGYRSPAYQVFVVIYNLVKKEYSFGEVLRWVALPGYSEHGYTDRQAIDLITENGTINGSEVTFAETEEYKWLLDNAGKFNFYLSYPQNNKWGVAFEPWHWHYNASR